MNGNGDQQELIKTIQDLVVQSTLPRTTYMAEVSRQNVTLRAIEVLRKRGEFSSEFKDRIGWKGE